MLLPEEPHSVLNNGQRKPTFCRNYSTKRATNGIFERTISEICRFDEIKPASEPASGPAVTGWLVIVK